MNRLKPEAWQSPDQYASAPPPAYGIPPDDYVSFSRVELGFLMACVGRYSGTGTPMYVGYCPAIRWRIRPKWAIAFDPAYVSSIHGDRWFGMAGFRPGVHYSLAQGKRYTSASSVYAVAGFDLWIPTTSRDVVPSVFLGGHLGLAMVVSWGRWGFGTELRGLVRGGVGNAQNALAHEMSSFRVGFEVRGPGLYVSFW